MVNKCCSFLGTPQNLEDGAALQGNNFSINESLQSIFFLIFFACGIKRTPYITRSDPWKKPQKEFWGIFCTFCIFLL